MGILASPSCFRAVVSSPCPLMLCCSASDVYLPHLPYLFHAIALLMVAVICWRCGYRSRLCRFRLSTESIITACSAFGQLDIHEGRMASSTRIYIRGARSVDKDRLLTPWFMPARDPARAISLNFLIGGSRRQSRRAFDAVCLIGLEFLVTFACDLSSFVSCFGELGRSTFAIARRSRRPYIHHSFRCIPRFWWPLQGMHALRPNCQCNIQHPHIPPWGRLHIPKLDQLVPPTSKSTGSVHMDV